MTYEQKCVREFMRVMGHPTPDTLTYLVRWPQELKDLRLGLIAEEFEELHVAVLNSDTVAAIDAVMDLLYVIHGFAVCLGIDGEAFFKEVHRSNMEKLGEDGKPRYRADGKILKPAGWKPPNILGELIRQEVNGASK